MSSSRRIDVICLVGALLALMLTVLFMNGEALGLQSAGSSLGYENRLFNPETVHTLAIAIDDWDGFLETCADEEYTPCSVVIDGEAWKNVAIRGKGNTSLSNVASMDSNRYSFKIEFDHYESGKSYHGLDKLCLNNIIQDNTYMKDFLTYRLMAEEGAAAPLCSYVYITVNGEDWGLYLAVEGVEDSFLLRNYGADSGELYKPDSMNFGGGGPGNGRSFNMENFLQERGNRNGTDTNGTDINSDGRFGGFPAFPMFPMETSSDGTFGAFPTFPMGTNSDGTSAGTFDLFQRFGSFGGGMGNSDVKLQYIDDDPDSYSDIFNNAKTDITEADQARLIAALKRLSDGEDLENTLDIDAVLRYFVVHNFVVNGDSYTGSMIHNYYLHENGGRLSMIPWDYNLAFGGFQGGSASSSINDAIDTPLSITGDGARPMADWMFQDETYTALYYQYFREFLENVDILGILDRAQTLIAPYVERDPTAFCTYEEFETGAAALRTFCELRIESVQGQLDGTIPATDDGQSADNSTLIDASGLTLSDMGSMMRGGGWNGRDDGNNANGGENNRQDGGNGGQDNRQDGGNSGFGGNGANGGFGDRGFGGMRGGPGGFPQIPNDFPMDRGGFSVQSTDAASDTNVWILLGASCAALLFGLLIACKYKFD